MNDVLVLSSNVRCARVPLVENGSYVREIV